MVSIMAEKKEKRYVSDNAQLMAEWDWEKNNKLGLYPNELTHGSGKKVWWKCSKGHEWEATVNNRFKGRNCPFCSNKKVLPGFNDLKSQYPDLMKEWNYEKNSINPESVSYGSDYKVWWICEKGHEWQTNIYFRTNNHYGCPICAKETQTSFPEQILFYYLGQLFEKVYNRYIINNCEIDIFIEDIMIGIEYDGYFFHSSTDSILKEQRKNSIINSAGITLYRIKETTDVSEIQFENNTFYLPRKYDEHAFETVLQNLIAMLGVHTDDSFINITRDRTIVHNNYISNIKEKSVSKLYPHIAKEWNYDKNGLLTPEMFTATSHKKVWWRCSKGHEWEAIISNRTDKNRGCPYCSNQKILAIENSVAYTHPQILEYWDFEKNEISPYDISFGADKIVHFKCKSNHEFSALLYAFIKTLKCPVCQNRKILAGYNDLATTHPQICNEWNYQRNVGVSPHVITYGSGKQIWWKCSKGHEWRASPNRRTFNKSGCPVCAKEKHKTT